MAQEIVGSNPISHPNENYNGRLNIKGEEENMKSIYIILAIIVVLGILIWGYLKYVGRGNSTTTPTQTQTLVVGQNTISIKNMNFEPANLEVSKGTTITWTNNDSVAHTVTSDNGKFESGQLAAGKTFEFTFNEVGSFSYHCSNHPTMKATIAVK